MSLQVSNQTTGRRTPQVYQGFGGGNGPAGAGAGGATGGGAGGGNAANGAGGGTGPRSAKGKQSQIPVAVSGTAIGEVASPSVPMTTVVYPGMGSGATGNTLLGVSVDMPVGFTVQKQQQLDHQYGMVKQHVLEAVMSNHPSVGKDAVLVQTAGARKATNGSSTNGAGAQATITATNVTVAGGFVVEKNAGSSAKKGDLESGVTGAAPIKAENKSSSVASEVVGKVRDSARSSGRTQQQQKSLLDESQKALTEIPKNKQTGGGNKTPQKQAMGGTDSSLAMEKPLAGFDVDGEEMESLLMEAWDYEDSPMPAQTSGKPKLLKTGPTAQSRVTPFKLAANLGKADGPLSIVLEQKTPPEEKLAKAAEAPVTPASGVGSDANIGRPLRSISGRRSTRPITDIKFTHHRKSTEANDSFSSLNVTVGSDIYMDSLRTPGSATRKRKDMTPESTSDPTRDGVESPKRARLDFSGFLGFVASPVTMLKNRLSRVKLQASTPRSLAVEEEDASKVVTAEVTTTTSNVTGPVSDDAGKTAANMEVDEKGAAATAEAEENKDSQSATGEGAALPEKNDDPSTQQSAPSADSEEEVEVKIVTDKQKQWCSVM